MDKSGIGVDLVLQLEDNGLLTPLQASTIPAPVSAQTPAGETPPTTPPAQTTAPTFRIPQTGDAARPALLLVLALCSAVLFMLLWRGGLRRGRGGRRDVYKRQLYGLIMNFAFGMNNGLALTVSRYFGAGDESGIRRAVGWMVTLSAAVSLVLTGCSLLGRDALLTVLQVPACLLYTSPWWAKAPSSTAKVQ